MYKHGGHRETQWLTCEVLCVREPRWTLLCHTFVGSLVSVFEQSKNIAIAHTELEFEQLLLHVGVWPTIIGSQFIPSQFAYKSNFVEHKWC